MKLTKLRQFALIGCVLILTPACPASSIFTGIHVFGDSLSDTGNLSLATGGANPGPDYYLGRFSNGPVWVEGLAARLGLAGPAPDLLPGGTNHAWAGAYSAGGPNVPSAQDQINGFVVAGGSFQPTDLVVIWASANDFLLGGVTDPNIPASNIAAAIQSLAAAGATTILVPNLPDLAATPAISSLNDPMASGGMNALTVGFNAILDGQMAALRTSLVGIDLIGLDIYSLGQEVSSNPGAFGITNTTDPALLIGDAANANDYIYYDGVHPTAAMHEIIAGRAAQALAVPEPSAVVFLAIGVFGVVLPRRRARCA